MRRLVASLAVVALVLPALITPQPVFAFGTTAGQGAEHERITRLALGCPPGVQSTGDCFEPKSLDQVAGKTGTFGAVGSPDSDEFLSSAAHCDDADFLDIPGYRGTASAAAARALRDTALQACVDHFRTRFVEGVSAADGLLDSNDDLIGKEVDLDTSDCTFFLGISRRAKCNAIEGLGRALHGSQDFYAHSNWADVESAAAISVFNPPGLRMLAPSPLLNLLAPAGTPIPTPPANFTTGRFVLGVDELGCTAAGLATGRVTHACLNKDEEDINVTTGAVTNPRTPRGQIVLAGGAGTNATLAVNAAISETRRQWNDFRSGLIAKYGAVRGGRMILAITQDIPKVDLVFAIDTTGSMSPFIAGVVTNANGIVDALSGRGSTKRLVDFRVGLVDYKDVDSTLPGCPPDYDAVTDLNFTSKRLDIVSAVNVLPGKVGGGCDIPEDVLSGINRAVGFPWRNGVRKAIIAMGDAPGHDPEAHSGLTSASVIAAANAVDPASIYPILVGFNPAATAFMSSLATGTHGKTFDSNASNVGQAVLDAINLIVTSPPTVDKTPPACALTAVIAGPPKQLQITVQDTGSGLNSIAPTAVTNATVNIPAFTAGTTSPVVVTATKIDQSLGASVTVRATDVAGNVTTCDPAMVTVNGGAGKAVSKVVTGVAQAESTVSIYNNKPGVKQIDVKVNGKLFKVTRLHDGEVRTIDVAAGLKAGNHNTIVLTPRGSSGSAEVLISDMGKHTAAQHGTKHVVVDHEEQEESAPLD